MMIKKKSNSRIPTKFRYFLNHMIMKQIYKFGKFLAFFFKIGFMFLTNTLFWQRECILNGKILIENQNKNLNGSR